MTDNLWRRRVFYPLLTGLTGRSQRTFFKPPLAAIGRHSPPFAAPYRKESKVQSPKSKVETARDALDRRVMGILILLPNAPGHSRSLPITPERVPNGRRCRRELSGAIGTDAASWREQSGAWAAGAARCS